MAYSRVLGYFASFLIKFTTFYVYLAKLLHSLSQKYQLDTDHNKPEVF